MGQEKDLNKPARDDFAKIIKDSAAGRANAERALDARGGVNCAGLKQGLGEMDAAVKLIDPYQTQYGSITDVKALKESLSPDTVGKLHPQKTAEAKKKCGITPSATK